MPEREAEVTAAGIARLAGVGRAAVSNWRRRFEDFPAPAGGTETSPRFALAEIESWLRTHGKLAAVPSRERLWQLVEADPAGPPAALAAVGEQLLEPGAAPPGAAPLAAATAEVADAQGPRATFDFLLDRWLAAAKNVTLTPPDTASLMAELAGPATTVLDPACGSGALLAAASGARELHGQEADPALARLAGLRLALRGDAAVQVRAGDSLLDDAFPLSAADAVLCHPPFNERHWGHDALAYDPRWEYGLPARTESELAWVQHALARLRPGGTAVLLMPPAAASRRTGRRVRAALLRRGALRAVIVLPPGAAPPHSLALHLWVLVRPDGDTAPDPRLLVVDATAAREPDGRPGPAWAAARNIVLDAWAAARAPGDVAEIPGVRRALPVIDLLDDEVDLAPARHLPPCEPGAASLAEVGRELTETLRRTQELTPRLPVDDTRPPGRWATVTVGELARTGLLELHTAGSEAPAEQPRSGDVLVSLTPDGPPPRVITDGTPPPRGRHTALLRPDPEALDPWFLAGFLRGSGNTRQASSYASAATRIELRRLRVPRLPPAEQRDYGRRFRELTAFETALDQASSLGRQLIRGTVDGLTEGRLPPVT